MLFHDLFEVQKACLRPPVFQEILVGLSWGVGYVPTGAYEDRVVGYVRRVHEERRGTLRRERLICGDANTLRDDRVANRQQLRGIMDVIVVFDAPLFERLI